MSQSKKYSLLSFALVAGLLAVVSWIKCSYVPHKLRIPANTILHAGKPADTAIFFIGSSRVGNSINAPYLQTALGKPVHLLSFAGGAFFTNTLLANYLLKQQGQKIILVELSPVTPNITAEFLTLLLVNKVNIWQQLQQVQKQDDAWQHRQFYVSLYNDILLQHLNLSTDLKWLSGTKQPVITQFKPLQGQKGQSAASFLPPGYLEHSNTLPGRDTSHLMQLVRILQSTASLHQGRLYFFSPVNFRQSGERPMVASVWKSLPANQRIAYPDSLLQAISHPEYLYDEIHLNANGARVISKGWEMIVDSLLQVRH